MNGRRQFVYADLRLAAAIAVNEAPIDWRQSQAITKQIATIHRHSNGRLCRRRRRRPPRPRAFSVTFLFKQLHLSLKLVAGTIVSSSVAI